MTPQQVVEHFGGIRETAIAVDVTYQAVRQWVDKGQVPEGRQWQIQVMTDGALVAQQKQIA